MKNYKELQNGSDIRGIAVKTEGGKDVNLTPFICGRIACGFVMWLSARTGKNYLHISIGRDPRVTSLAIEENIREVIARAGCEVHICGLATTPEMFMSTVIKGMSEPACDGAIMITASHLPYDRNGLKFFTKHGCLEKSDIETILLLAENVDDNFSIN